MSAAALIAHRTGLPRGFIIDALFALLLVLTAAHVLGVLSGIHFARAEADRWRAVAEARYASAEEALVIGEHAASITEVCVGTLYDHVCHCFPAADVVVRR